MGRVIIERIIEALVHKGLQKIAEVGSNKSLTLPPTEGLKKRMFKERGFKETKI